MYFISSEKRSCSDQAKDKKKMYSLSRFLSVASYASACFEYETREL